MYNVHLRRIGRNPPIAVRTSIDEARPLLSGEFGGFRFGVVGSPLHD
jgi:hypothetical protein